MATSVQEMDWPAWAPLVDGMLAKAGQEALSAAEIPIERFTGSMLLLSGRDDRLWPATQLTSVAIRRRLHFGLPSVGAVRHISYAFAGHRMSALPGNPLSAHIIDPRDGARLDLGGTDAGTAAAASEVWRRIPAFFLRALT